MIDQDDDKNSAQPWLDKLAHAERKFNDWQVACDNIDKMYSDLSRLRDGLRDREFALFWSNIQVLQQAIYARPPEPVVTPKFKDRRPLYRTSSEFLERCTKISFDLGGLDEQLLQCRDDLAIVGRAAMWAIYEDEDGETERVVYEHVDRKDFLHEAARKWSEVDWVARRAWMTCEALEERFGEAAADLVAGMRGEAVGKSAGTYLDETSPVWEIWCKSANRVVWVSENCEHVLDDGEPHLDLDGFFPCPKPAYATLQRGTLIPVPDMLYYKDQLEEVNDLTRRIGALSRAIKVRGFYTGGGDLGAAVERAIFETADEQVLIPVPGLGELMVKSGGQPIIWLPLDMIASTITGLIELRRQVIEDIYQIMGMSDIMRGVTDAGETLGAQRIKQQNSSFRVRDKQNEMVRLARDLCRIGAEIMADEFDRKTLEGMAQMDLPTNADVKKSIKGIEDGVKSQISDMEEQAAAALEQVQDPAQAQQIQQQLEQQQMAIVQQSKEALSKASQQVTIDQVMEFLKDERLRPFVLDIETDSTIYPDEQQEKASRGEFMQVFNQSIPALQAAAAMGPQALALAGGVFKFALAPYRVGRELEGMIEDFVDSGAQIAQSMNEEEDDGGLAAAQMKLAEAEMAKVQSQTQANEANAQLKMQELQLKAQEFQAKTAQDQQKFGLEIQKTQGDIAETKAQIDKIMAEIQKMGIDATNATRTQDRDDFKTAADVQARQTDQVMKATQPEPAMKGPQNG